MNRTELTQNLADRTGVSVTDCRAVIDSFGELLADTLARGSDINLTGLGKFSAVDRPERQGTNPATGEAITIAASKQVKFTPAKALKDFRREELARRQPEPISADRTTPPSSQ
jgi:DNA-binding protein HU-beta